MARVGNLAFHFLALQGAFAATINYSYNDSQGMLQETAAEILWPSSKPKGVILQWHGTILGGLPNQGSTVAQDFQSMNSDIEFGMFKSDHILVMPHQLGLGRSKSTHNQLWQQLMPVQKDGDALLEAIYMKSKADYSLADKERLNLFITGHSQGGTSSVMYHQHVQSSKSQTPSMYELKQTVASAGHYSSAVWEASCMSSYSTFAADPEMQRSFRTANLPMAKEMQNVLLTHLLHTYNTTVGSGDIMYEAAPSLASSDYKDDWSQMGKMIGMIMNQQDDSSGTPAFLTAGTWTMLTNASSSLRKGLREYLDKQYGSIAANLQSNAIPLELVYACDDLNVPCAHALVLPQSAPHVTFTDNSAAVPNPLTSPFDGHGAAQTQWMTSIKAKITALKDTSATPYVPMSTAMPTCLDVKRQYQALGCCGMPTKAFEMPASWSASGTAGKRRLAGPNDVLEDVKSALKAAKLEGGQSEAGSLAKTLIEAVQQYVLDASSNRLVNV